MWLAVCESGDFCGGSTMVAGGPRAYADRESAGARASSLFSNYNTSAPAARGAGHEGTDPP